MFLHLGSFYDFLRNQLSKVENIVYWTCVAFGVRKDAMINLLSLPLNVFAKSASCPSAEALLGFAQSLPVPDQLNQSPHT
jgi:hypothetical protein